MTECDAQGELVDSLRRQLSDATRGTTFGRERSLEEWRALVAGDWTVLDFADRDGKRFIVARRSQGATANLSDAEREVLGLAAGAHANKFISYELGVSMATVTTRMQRGLKKLGLRTRTELIALHGASR
jgi:DNA-binding NarL/FixJ family response regulator